jgi:hypothetical protein
VRESQPSERARKPVCVCVCVCVFRSQAHVQSLTQCSSLHNSQSHTHTLTGRDVHPAARVNPRVVGERSRSRVDEQVCERCNVLWVVSNRLDKHLPRRVVVVVLPSHSSCFNLVEKGLLRVELSRLVVVPHLTVRQREEGGGGRNRKCRPR